MNAHDLVLPLLAAAVACLSLPLWADLVALARSLGPVRPPPSGAELPRLLFLVPAHDEEALLARCVDSIVGSLYPAAALRTVVIADNCADRTAAIARARGAECLERRDPERRGKPHAIAWALDRLDRDWDAVVIVDADSEVARDFALALARQGPLEHRVVQAYFGIRNPDESWLTRLADLLNRSTYRHRYVRKSRAGLNCPMTGNGMCIGRGVLAAHPWRTASLTENWELYAQYTAGGVPIAYARGARLLSQEARTMRQGEVQRQRWTAGRFDVLRRWALPVLRSRSIGWAQKLGGIL